MERPPGQGVASIDGWASPLAPAADALLLHEIEAARNYRSRARAANTLRSYASDWGQFMLWCAARALVALPARPEIVATYLAALAQAGKAHSTVARHLAAVAWHHRQAGHATPSAHDKHSLIADTLSGIRREQHGRPSRRKAALGAEAIARMIAAAGGEGSRAIRDRAILALGLGAALRRSELVALELADLTLATEGARLRIRHSKTDQAGAGHEIAVPNGASLKPVAHLRAWLAVRGEGAGPLFTRFETRGHLTAEPMSDRSIARLVQRYAALIGLDPTTVAGHSLRAGFLTEAARHGASLARMQEVSRHKKIEVLLGYVRSAELFEDHAGSGFL